MVPLRFLYENKCKSVDSIPKKKGVKCKKSSGRMRNSKRNISKSVSYSKSRKRRTSKKSKRKSKK